MAMNNTKILSVCAIFRWTKELLSQVKNQTHVFGISSVVTAYVNKKPQSYFFVYQIDRASQINIDEINFAKLVEQLSTSAHRIRKSTTNLKNISEQSRRIAFLVYFNAWLAI